MENKNVSESKQNEIGCKNCGAKLKFAPGTDSLECQFCGALNEIEIVIIPPLLYFLYSTFL